MRYKVSIAVLAAAAPLSVVHAQSVYPNKVVRIVVVTKNMREMIALAKTRPAHGPARVSKTIGEARGQVII
jgi:hypothetical protein